MDNKPTDETADEKRARTMQLMRKVWTGLIVMFIVVIVLNLYNWSQGDGDLRGIFSPLAMIFVGLGTIVSASNRKLSYVLSGIGAIFAITALVLLIVY